MVNKILAFTISSLILLMGSCGKRSIASEPMEADDINPGNKSSQPIYDQLAKELDSTEIYNDFVIYGYWFQPHAASSVNVFLHKDGRFELTYCDNRARGTFVMDGHIVKMTPEDGWGGIQFDGRLFHKHNGTNFYLTDSKEEVFYLVKGSD